MDRRQQSRVNSTLPVRIWGIDAYDRPFLQLASASNISEQGVQLHGLRCRLKPGEVIEVQYSGTKAQFMVVWVGTPGTHQAGEIGLQKLPTEPSLWGELRLQHCMEFVAQG